MMVVYAPLTEPIRLRPAVEIQLGMSHVYICTRLRQPWAQIWPQLRHYD
jgi:hypothetical protein